LGRSRESAVSPRSREQRAAAALVGRFCTWETNWYNEFIRDDHCTATP